MLRLFSSGHLVIISIPMASVLLASSAVVASTIQQCRLLFTYENSSLLSIWYLVGGVAQW